MIYAKIKRIDDGYDTYGAPRAAEVIKLICKREPSVCAHVDAILKKKDQSALAASLCAFETLLELCAEHGISPGSVSLAKTELGRPYFTSHNDTDFSISHTSRYVAVALATGKGERVGIDVEDARRLKGGSDIGKIAERFFVGAELSEFSGGGESTEKFMELWTRKEAYLKYTGEGIAKMTSTDTLSALPHAVAFVCDSVGVVATDTYFTLCYSPSTSEPNINCQT